MLKIALEKLSEEIYPSSFSCYNCSDEITNNGKYNLCSNCLKSLNPIKFPCEVCGDELNSFTRVCEKCKNTNRYFDRVESVTYYDNVGKELVHKLKYNSRIYLAKSIGALLSRKFKTNDFDKIDLVVCVPLSDKKLKSRGFNQAEEILKYFIEFHNKDVLEFEREIINSVENDKALSKVKNKNCKITKANKNYFYDDFKSYKENFNDNNILSNNLLNANKNEDNEIENFEVNLKTKNSRNLFSKIKSFFKIKNDEITQIENEIFEVKEVDLKEKYYKNYYYLSSNTTCLKRVKDTISQTMFSKSERAENLKDAFVLENVNINNKNILIIDDVITTGSTLQEIAKLLKENGARKVYGLTLCHTALEMYKNEKF